MLASAAETHKAEPGEEDEVGCAFVLDLSDADAAQSQFCGAPRRPGSAYCSAHHASCHLATGSRAERLRLREMDALARAVGGKSGGDAPQPPLRLLRRLHRIARAFSR